MGELIGRHLNMVRQFGMKFAPLWDEKMHQGPDVLTRKKHVYDIKTFDSSDGHFLVNVSQHAAAGMLHGYLIFRVLTLSTAEWYKVSYEAVNKWPVRGLPDREAHYFCCCLLRGDPGCFMHGWVGD
jgi:hypothetical protein